MAFMVPAKAAYSAAIGAVATADDLPAAVAHAYEVAAKVKFENAYCRKDIGKRALAALK
jgi:phosphoribosylamine-glycine ligase